MSDREGGRGRTGIPPNQPHILGFASALLPLVQVGFFTNKAFGGVDESALDQASATSMSALRDFCNANDAEIAERVEKLSKLILEKERCELRRSHLVGRT